MLHFVCLNSSYEKPVSVEGLLELVPQQGSKEESVDSCVEQWPGCSRCTPEQWTAPFQHRAGHGSKGLKPSLISAGFWSGPSKAICLRWATSQKCWQTNNGLCFLWIFCPTKRNSMPGSIKCVFPQETSVQTSCQNFDLSLAEVVALPSHSFPLNIPLWESHVLEEKVKWN